LLYPDDVTGDEVRQRNAEMFSTSQSHAIAAALRYLDIPVTEELVATAVFEGSPSAGTIQAGDHILSIDGVPADGGTVVVETVRAAPIGTTFTFEIERGAERTPETVQVTSAANPDSPSTPYIGLSMGYYYRGPMPIAFTLQDIGGPSAGLFFALAIVDKLSPEDLAAGRHIAGTGTIDPDGAVGPIGGIRQKIAGAAGAGAQLFLMPRAHCDEANGYVPDGLTVVPVDSLSGAVDAIKTWRQGAPLPTCPS
jgi:PDZ domain-containing protein